MNIDYYYILYKILNFIFYINSEVKERHALDNWKRHSIEWSKIEERIAKKINRVFFFILFMEQL